LEDRGVLVLLDPRIRRQRYGQTFLNSLPPYRMTATITDVESFFSSPPPQGRSLKDPSP
jgi:ATP-dependent DNA helicase DinG